jgi:outer membrane protein
MTRLVVLALLTMFGAAPTFAQTAAGQAAPPQPAQAQPAQPQPAPPAQPPRPFPEGAKVAYINTQRIANESGEGKAATTKLKALNDKKMQELNDKQKQLQAAQQKLQQGGSVLSDQARAQLEKDIEKMQVDIQRFTQDAQAEVQDLTQQLQAEFERKLRPVIAAVSAEKGLHMVFGPESGIVWADGGLDITGDVIKRFDQASAAPAAPPK